MLSLNNICEQWCKNNSNSIYSFLTNELIGSAIDITESMKSVDEENINDNKIEISDNIVFLAIKKGLIYIANGKVHFIKESKEEDLFLSFLLNNEIKLNERVKNIELSDEQKVKNSINGLVNIYKDLNADALVDRYNSYECDKISCDVYAEHLNSISGVVKDEYKKMLTVHLFYDVLKEGNFEGNFEFRIFSKIIREWLSKNKNERMEFLKFYIKVLKNNGIKIDHSLQILRRNFSEEDYAKINESEYKEIINKEISLYKEAFTQNKKEGKH